ncbi:putative oligopeptide ABC transporter,periplasmic oligopeptide-binding domain protein, partial [Vibrio parahaemolyticus V-223/04]
LRIPYLTAFNSPQINIWYVRMTQRQQRLIRQKPKVCQKCT